MKTAVFPGSFDPLTNGHVDIVHRSLTIFDRVVVGVLANSSKQPLFTVEERIELIEAQFQPLGERVVVRSFSGLLVDFVATVGTTLVVRGLRAISDYDYEAQMALMNKNLDDRVETFFLMAREENSYVSSSLVKQVAPLGGDVSKLVPPVVRIALQSRFKELRERQEK